MTGKYTENPLTIVLSFLPHKSCQTLNSPSLLSLARSPRKCFHHLLTSVTAENTSWHYKPVFNRFPDQLPSLLTLLLLVNIVSYQRYQRSHSLKACSQSGLALQSNNNSLWNDVYHKDRCSDIYFLIPFFVPFFFWQIHHPSKGTTIQQKLTSQRFMPWRSDQLPSLLSLLLLVDLSSFQKHRPSPSSKKSYHHRRMKSFKQTSQPINKPSRPINKHSNDTLTHDRRRTTALEGQQDTLSLTSHPNQ